MLAVARGEVADVQGAGVAVVALVVGLAARRRFHAWDAIALSVTLVEQSARILVVALSPCFGWNRFARIRVGPFRLADTLVTLDSWGWALHLLARKTSTLYTGIPLGTTIVVSVALLPIHGSRVVRTLASRDVARIQSAWISIVTVLVRRATPRHRRTDAYPVLTGIVHRAVVAVVTLGAS